MTLFNPWIPANVRTRFLSYVDTTPGKGKCWPWTACRNRDGYGRYSLPRLDGGRSSVQATRIMMFLMHGTFDKDLVVRHKCDNPSCMNPEHLELGTRFDNARDMTERQRQSRGETHPKTAVTERIVREIRRRGLEGEAFTVIARDMGLNVNTVTGIAKGRTWKHIPGDVVTESRKLDPAKVAQARRWVACGGSIRAAAKELGISYPSLVTAVRGRHPRWEVDIEGVDPIPVEG